MIFLAVISLTLAFIATLAVLRERDVLKAVVYSSIESVFYAVALSYFLAPDLLIAYIAIGLGVNSVLFVYVLSKGERYEE
ncbi:Na(+)/H(+) antiporter subunit B [Desulfurococcus amylolyticus]|uniref:MrpA C-terminal/MbhD domain-containing protein n=1 Tax=Desulfurococcus amylolyticus (strain DSM 18924 / JCM 16383 / VKM B-2413 / 1221n) TaxID=490899 RepID=B8D595_DESA1|nr:DUF4040 domain-containing protein [Desulfurococcus amylolyticus]ACL11276.1 hypothetical protein DKAM_0950 [Desulfurococcus amylolyticus 1221n]